MKTALADYLAQEALLMGAIPVIKATMLPYLWPNGINGDGEFGETSFHPGSPPFTFDSIVADYHGFTYGYWRSPIIESDMQDASTDAILSWIWNSPGYDSGDIIIYRTGNTAAEVLTAAWSSISNGGVSEVLSTASDSATISISPVGIFLLRVPPGLFSTFPLTKITLSLLKSFALLCSSKFFSGLNTT